MNAPVDGWDWTMLLKGIDRLHLSGITPALGPTSAATAIAAARAASDQGIAVSFDGNYRARLWDRWDGDAAEILREIVAHATILFGNHRDIALLLGLEFDDDDVSDAPTDAAFEAFPRLELVASTARLSDDVDSHRLRANLTSRHQSVRTNDITLSGIVDRIGTGDAFAAGVLHAIDRGDSLATVAATGMALSALKHSLPGDASLFNRSDLEHFLRGDLNVRR
jgi:2-dehydro-3-deoxygluconokinase